MIFKLLVIFVLLTPLLGIYQVENGAYAWSVNGHGYNNGATISYSIYLAIFIIFWHISSNTKTAAHNRQDINHDHRKFLKFITVGNIIFALILIFLFGGHRVILGTVGKGEFRTTLGAFGSVAFLITKWLMPMTFAYMCSLKKFTPHESKTISRYITTNALIILIAGLSWGYKTTSLMAILPGLIILKWHSPYRSIIKIALLFIAAIWITFILFDDISNTIYDNAAMFLWARTTVLQGDVAWYLWGEHVNGNLNYDYFNTLGVVIGDNLWSLLSGITRNNEEKWVMAHYGLLLTYAAGYPISGILEGHSVTATPFAEGLIAAGTPGFLAFAAIAGTITGFVQKKLTIAIQRKNSLFTAIWSCYFMACVFPWLNAGAITNLLHISVLFSILVCSVYITTTANLFRQEQKNT